MREERGQIPGDVVVYEHFTLWGSIGGNVTVIQGGKLYVRGSIYGNMSVEQGGRVHILGNLTGDLTVHPDAKVIVSGIVGGSITNLGGRVQVESSAQVHGKIRTKDGKTVVEEKKPPRKHDDD
jgi:cytoskeletal protein CcmA (bactofilin family)